MLTRMKHRSSQLNMAEMTWTLRHALSASLALEIPINRSKTRIHQPSSFRLVGCFVHNFRMLDFGDRVGFLWDRGMGQDASCFPGAQHLRFPLVKGYQTEPPSLCESAPPNTQTGGQACWARRSEEEGSWVKTDGDAKRERRVKSRTRVSKSVQESISTNEHNIRRVQSSRGWPKSSLERLFPRFSFRTVRS